MHFWGRQSIVWAGTAACLFSCTLDTKPVADGPTSWAGDSRARPRGTSVQAATLDAGIVSAPASRGKQATTMQDAGAQVGVSSAAGGGGNSTANTPRVPGAASAGSQADAGTRRANAAGAGNTGDAGKRDDAGARDAGRSSVADASVVDAKRCPSFPSAQDESFCYDFESGVYGPKDGETYDLWPTPQAPLAGELSTAGQPGMTQGHVLVTVPTFTGRETAATISHSVQHFDSATVTFELWANDALLQASDAVSCFRFVPIDEDNEQVVALYFSRGRGALRSEGGDDYPLTKLPRTDGTPSHVSVHMERGSSCSAEVRFDGELVASAPPGACASEHESFVEFGLYMRASESSEIGAYFDNIAFTRE